MWIDDITLALKRLDGIGTNQEIYEEIKKIRTSLSNDWHAVVRRTIQQNSSDTQSWEKKNDLYYSVSGIGKGIWGLRNYYPDNVNDVPDELDGIVDSTVRKEYTIQRIVRDSYMIAQLKIYHNHKCQICNDTLKISNDKFYSEGHHIKPLGKPHNGPDKPENIIIVCPNCHVLCDYKNIKLDKSNLNAFGREISKDYIDYHNKIYKSIS